MKIKEFRRFTCPECHYRPWGVGKGDYNEHHCMCGWWDWTGETWVWRKESD